MAARELGEQYPEGKMIVIDSLCASLGQGMLVYLAAQEKAKREQEQRAHDRAAAAARHASIIAFIQRVGGHGAQVPPVVFPTPTPENMF